MWKSKTWASKAPKELLKELKEELKTRPHDEQLRSHIVQLKKAWGVRIRLPKAEPQAA